MNFTLPDLVNFVTTAGPGAIFGVLWWLERSERREKDRDNRELLERGLKAIDAAATSVASLRDLINAGGRR